MILDRLQSKCGSRFAPRRLRRFGGSAAFVNGAATPPSARRGMLRPIWSHPECPTKEDIRDELRRSERNRGLKPATSISGVPLVRKAVNPVSIFPLSINLNDQYGS